MKKKLVVLLAGALALCLVACGDDSKDNNSSTESASVNNEQTTGSSSNEQTTGKNEIETTTEETVENAEITLEDVLNHKEAVRGDIELRENAEGNWIFTGYNGTDEILVLPETYNAKPIVKIEQYSLANNNNVARAIKFSDSVVEIADSSCILNDSLEIVIMGKNTKTIGPFAFQQCTSLKEVILNEGLEKIDKSAFASCRSLEKITIPSTVTEIVGSAFLMIEEQLTIYGEAGSYAEQYANECGIKFIAQ